MDFQTMVNNQMKAIREAELKYSPQLTVQEIIFLTQCQQPAGQ